MNDILDLNSYFKNYKQLIYIDIFIGKWMKHFLPNLEATGSSPVGVTIIKFFFFIIISVSIIININLLSYL